MKVLEVAFFCYAVSDMAKSRPFYEDLLGLKPTKVTESEGGKWVEYDIAATTLAIGQSPMFPPSPIGASAALEMENFDEAIAELKKAGVKIAMGPFETPVCHMAMICDPDDNKICIHKRKPGHN